jgi:hypothetical protein
VRGMYTVLAIALSFMLVGNAQGQTHQKTYLSDSQAESLAAPRNWGSITLQMFPDSDRRVIFTLVTSWIPGENHAGMFRYKVQGTPFELTLAQRAQDMNIPASTEKLMRRIHACDVELDLYDADGFILRKVPIVFDYGVYGGQVQSLIANDSSQMDASEYRKLVGTSSNSGSWNIAWVPPAAQ